MGGNRGTKIVNKHLLTNWRFLESEKTGGGIFTSSLSVLLTVELLRLQLCAGAHTLDPAKTYNLGLS